MGSRHPLRLFREKKAGAFTAPRSSPLQGTCRVWQPSERNWPRQPCRVGMLQLSLEFRQLEHLAARRAAILTPSPKISLLSIADAKFNSNLRRNVGISVGH